MLSKLLSLPRRVLGKIRRTLNPSPGSATQASAPLSEYQQRLAKEVSNFDQCTNVHELPAIFHYWSNKYLAPKLNQFGITDPEQFFLLYAEKFHQRFPNKPLVMLSIGSGNCDMEARLARKLVDKGISNFQLECLDINQTMLARGREHAATLGVSQQIVPVCADFNSWQPDKSYDVIMANQCLHHVVELEQLFALIKRCLNPEGYFLASDMIGRNGHQRWPEALTLVQQFWTELPDSYRYNQLMRRHEASYINHDCAVESFEGIRAQDILPLLLEYFQFELFVPFANIVTAFIDRPFGHNFKLEGQWDRDFIDRVHARDEQGLLSGELTPTQMLAVLRIVPVETQLLDPRLTPANCIRGPQPCKGTAMPAPASPFVAGQLQWRCNICGSNNHCMAISIERESGPCKHCGSVMRFRSLIAVLTERLLGKSSVLAELPPQKNYCGIGMSDAHTYASVLSEKFTYTNTFYHCEPLLDITKPGPEWLGKCDFVITSDVYEHVPPPIQRAFDHLFALLKPGGVVIFSVPYLLEAATFEHYPNLHDFTITQEAAGDWVLHNTTVDGQREDFRNLVFHGGPGSTLELRLFSLAPLQQHFTQAGFVDLQIHSAPCFEHGIHWQGPWSITLSAKRPG